MEVGRQRASQKVGLVWMWKQEDLWHCNSSALTGWSLKHIRLGLRVTMSFTSLSETWFLHLKMGVITDPISQGCRGM